MLLNVCLFQELSDQLREDAGYSPPLQNQIELVDVLRHGETLLGQIAGKLIEFFVRFFMRGIGHPNVICIPRNML